MPPRDNDQPRKTAAMSGKRKRKPSTNVIDSIVSNGYVSLKRKAQKSSTLRSNSAAVISSNIGSQSQNATASNDAIPGSIDDRESEGGIKISQSQSVQQGTSNNSIVHSQHGHSETQGTIDLVPAVRGSTANLSLSIGTTINDSPPRSTTFVPPVDSDGQHLVRSQHHADKFDQSILSSLQKKVGEIVKTEVRKAISSLSGKVDSIEANISRCVDDVMKDLLKGVEVSIDIIKDDVRELISTGGERSVASSKSAKLTDVETKIDKFS